MSEGDSDERLQVGSSWAYRARSVDDVVPVEILKHGTKRPVRVLVRFVDPDAEGREEWVPPARCKVPWEQADAFRARETRWDAVLDQSPRSDTAETEAAKRVFEWLVPEAVADLHWRDLYVAVLDRGAFESLAGIEDAAAVQTAFEEDGSLIVPWPIGLRAAQVLAYRSADDVLRHVDQEEREFQRDAIHGRSYGSRGRGTERYVSPEIVMEIDEEHGRPVREMLRSWCGADAVERHDELAELRKEIKRVGDIADEAISALRAAGRMREADELAARLGEPVGMLRVDQPGGS